MSDNSVQESWNMATATLKRFDQLLNQCSYFSQNGFLMKWFSVLMDLRRNLHPFMDADEFKEVEDKLGSLPKDWCAGGRIIPTNFAKVNQVFDEVYIIFVDIMKAKGLLMPKSTDVKKSILDM